MIMRCAALLVTLFVLGCSDGSDSSHARGGEPPPPLGLEVTLDSGIALGQDHPESEVWEWLAVPFARPPVGDLRWRAPQPVQPWAEVRETLTFGSPCPQFSATEDVVIGEEDCLHLNVWRPRTQERDLPVYVWIHGGSNTSGTNSGSVYQGDRLARQSNLVVVSIQYRLGPLGWLYYEPLHTGDPLDDSGNFGLLDIARSLRWIQDNIVAFGGDTDNVIITGESAGAINIMSLLVSEQASGLFHKAIMQSGLPQDSTPEEGIAGAAVLWDNLTALMGAPLTDPTNEERAEFLRSRSAAELLEASVGPAGAFTDGTVMPTQGAALFMTGEHINKVPIIVGTNRDEVKLWTNPLVLNAFPTLNAEVRAGVGRYGSDLWRARGADQFATDITSAPEQPDVYVYRFNWGSPDAQGNSPLPAPFGQTLGAHHGMEIPFVLGNWEEWVDPRGTDVFFTEANAAGRQDLSEGIMKYFASFAYSGNPNGENLPAWEPFTVSGDFKALEMDVDLVDNSAKFTADNEVYSPESVLADIDANLVEPTRSAVLALVFTGGLVD